MTEERYYYGDDGQEHLDGSLAEYMERYLDLLTGPPAPVLTVGRYLHQEPGMATGTVLEGLLEVLDENYGDPDGSATEPTEAMLDAERAFVHLVIEEYRRIGAVWQCRKVDTIEVQTEEWWNG